MPDCVLLKLLSITAADWFGQRRDGGERGAGTGAAFADSAMNAAEFERKPPRHARRDRLRVAPPCRDTRLPPA